jgi:hypothetical protein
VGRFLAARDERRLRLELLGQPRCRKIFTHVETRAWEGWRWPTASDARPTASRNTGSVGRDMPVTWGRVDGRADVRVPARATPIEGLAGWSWSAGLSASLHDWSSDRGFYNHRVADQPGHSEWRRPDRQMTGPGGGRPRDDDGALAAEGPVGGLGWSSWGGGPTWAER